MAVEDQILAELKALNQKFDLLGNVIIDYINRAEKEVPEYLRRLSMYYNDMFHMKILWEQSGQQLPDEFREEIERTHIRLMQCIEEETNQGGKFHMHKATQMKEGRSLKDWKGRRR